MPHAHTHTLDPLRGVFCHVRFNIFPPSIYCSMGIVHARFPRPH